MVSYFASYIQRQATICSGKEKERVAECHIYRYFDEKLKKFSLVAF